MLVNSFFRKVRMVAMMKFMEVLPCVDAEEKLESCLWTEWELEEKKKKTILQLMTIIFAFLNLC